MCQTTTDCTYLPVDGAAARDLDVVDVDCHNDVVVPGPVFAVVGNFNITQYSKLEVVVI